MEIYDKVRMKREENHWTQAEMAEKMEMSVSGYAKIERGETKLLSPQLEKIVQIFGIGLAELLDNGRTADYSQNIHNSGDNCSNIRYSDELSAAEIGRLNTLLEAKNQEINLLKQIIAALEKQVSLLEADKAKSENR